MPFPSKTDQETILTTAAEIVDRDGAGALTMREIARRLELAPNALYHHFKDRNELEAEVAAEGFRQLLAAIRKAANQGGGRSNSGAASPETAIRTSKAYLRFARTRPALYQLMIRRHTPTPGLLSVRREHEEFTEWLFGWMGSPDVRAEARFAFFSMLHGIANLEAASVLEDELKRDPTNAISALLDGLSRLKSKG